MNARAIVLALVLTLSAGAVFAGAHDAQAASPAAGAAPPAGDERILPPADDGAHDPGANQLLVMLRLPATHYRPDATYGGRYMDDSGGSGRRRRAEALAQQHGMTVVEGWAMSLLGIDCYVMRYKLSLIHI